MDTGAIPLLTEVHLLIPNEIHNHKYCKYCGQEIKQQPKYIYQKGHFIGVLVDIDEDDAVLLHICEYYDDKTDTFEKVVVKHTYFTELIDSPYRNQNIEPDLDFECYSKDINIFKQKDYYIENQVFVFKTKEEALTELKRLNKGD